MEEYFDKAISFENLYDGMKKSCRNVRWKDSVVGYEAHGLRNTLQLRNELLNGKYKISKYQTFCIHEPKERTIVATRIRDRQFQRSLCDAGLYDDICEHFIRDNVACQVGKGTDDAIDRLKTHLRRFYAKHKTDGWVLKCDVHHFFQETSHKVAKDAVMKYVSDKQAAYAVCNIIDSFDGDKGIGLGSQVSQLVQLLVLNDLDHFIKERLHIKYYIRYMDDFILIHEDREYLKECRKQISQKLAEIGLQLNKKTSLFPIAHGVTFLKWRFVLNKDGKILLLLDPKKITKQRKRLKKLLLMEKSGKLKEGTAENSLVCWIANAQRGNTYKIIEEMKDYYRKIRSEIYDERVSQQEASRLCGNERRGNVAGERDCICADGGI